MAIIVNTNMTALKSQRNLTSATNSMTKSLERMSTGYKINSAKDDAAGLYVATGLETQIRGSKVAQSNATTGINVLQTIEGDLDNILTNLNRIRDLATQAANSIYSDEVMNAMGKEVEARIEEINRISKASNFNGLTLLDGESRLEEQGLRLQIGANANPDGNSIEIGKEFFAKVDATTLGSGATVYGETIDGNDTVDSGAVKAFGDGTATNPPAASAAADYIAVLDVAINSISSNKFHLLISNLLSFKFQQSNVYPTLVGTTVSNKESYSTICSLFNN